MSVIISDKSLRGVIPLPESTEYRDINTIFAETDNKPWEFDDIDLQVYARFPQGFINSLQSFFQRFEGNMNKTHWVAIVDDVESNSSYATVGCLRLLAIRDANVEVILLEDAPDISDYLDSYGIKYRKISSKPNEHSDNFQSGKQEVGTNWVDAPDIPIWYEWEADTTHVKNAANFAGLPTFSSPPIFMALANAVSLFRPDSIFVIHSYKLGFVAYFAAISHHLGCPVYSVNRKIYDDSHLMSHIETLGLNEHVERVEWDPFDREASPFQMPESVHRPMILFNVNEAWSLERFVDMSLKNIDEAFLVFHAPAHGDTKEYLPKLRRRLDVKEWAVRSNNEMATWCEGGMLILDGKNAS